MSATFTVVGARGFVGGVLAKVLRASGREVIERRSDESPDTDCGHVVYVSGVAWGADSRPGDAFDVHVERVRRALNAPRADSFTFVSSTRVYDGAASTAEDASLTVQPGRAADVYAISKIAGENLVLAQNDARLRVVRLSNVFGPSFRSELFLSQLLRAAVRDGKVALRSGLGSSKDYVAVSDAVELVRRIAEGGRERVYNIAKGENTTHADILTAIVAATGAAVEIAPGSPETVVPVVSIERIRAEFGAPKVRVCDAIPDLALAFAGYERAAR